MKILILGGYGVFGGRLAELLNNIHGLELYICGRNLSKAEAFCARYTGLAVALPLELHRAHIAEGLKAITPDLVVDASGPFQDYGVDSYEVIRACIQARVNYFDFADAADFVFGVSQFDDQAKQAGVVVLSGVSSFPVLTAAVLRKMAKEMDIVSVKGGIAPSPFAGIGLNVMRAVVGYAGSPVKLLRGGRQTHGIGLAESMRYTIAVPGRLPLQNIHFSLVDVPDLQVLPPEHETMTDIWMGAGPVPEILHRILNLLATVRSRFGLPSLKPFSRLFYRVLNLMKFGEHRGGMFVQVSGVADGRPVEQSWHLIAEGDDGPYIPSMAIEGLIRKMLAGERLAAGARPGTHALELSDYDALFANRNIHTGFRNEAQNQPLYYQVLGSSFDTLALALKALHGSDTERKWTGITQVREGRSFLASVLRALIGFPGSGSMPVSVTFTPENGGERWTRNFNGKIFNSLQTAGTGHDQYLLVEQFGIATFSLALVIENERLLLIPRRWKLLNIPMPKALLPKGVSFETEANGKFHFDVEISAPLVGLIVAYKGSLALDKA